MKPKINLLEARLDYPDNLPIAKGTTYKSEEVWIMIGPQFDQYVVSKVFFDSIPYGLTVKDLKVMLRTEKIRRLI